MTRYCPDIEYSSTAASPTAYYELLLHLWSEGDTFIIIEHDIEITPTIIPSLLKCPQQWCGAIYSVSNTPKAAAFVMLGLTKFSSQLIKKHPDLMQVVGLIDDDGLARKDWHRNDTRIDRVLRQRGYTPCPHERVNHHHNYGQQ